MKIEFCWKYILCFWNKNIASKLFTASLIFYSYSRSQTDSSFNSVSVSEFKLSFTPEIILFLNSNNDKNLDFVSLDSKTNTLWLNEADSIGGYFNFKEIKKSGTITSIKSSDVNRDSLDDIILVHHSLNKIEVLLNNKNNNFTSTFYDVNFYPDKVEIFDFNRDGILDLCSYGKVASGVTILLGKKNGKFSQGEVLFDEIPIEEIYPVYLNSDKEIDLAIKNWLTNEMIYYFGMGDLQFYVYDVVSLKDEESKIFYFHANSDNFTDYLVSNKNKIDLFLTNNIGSAKQNISFTLDEEINFVDTATSQNTLKKYLLVSTKKNEINFINMQNGNDSFDYFSFSIPFDYDKFFFCDLNKDSQKEIILFNGSNMYTLWFNQTDNLIQENIIFATQNNSAIRIENKK